MKIQYENTLQLKPLTRGITGVIPGGISVIDFAIAAQTDQIGINRGVAVLIDCKHWKRMSSSTLREIVKKQVARVKHYVGKTQGTIAVPAIVTLYQEEISFIDNVPIIPILQFSSFLDEFYGNLDDLKTIET